MRLVHAKIHSMLKWIGLWIIWAFVAFSEACSDSMGPDAAKLYAVFSSLGLSTLLLGAFFALEFGQFWYIVLASVALYFCLGAILNRMLKYHFGTGLYA